jgi:hypothetical protein
MIAAAPARARSGRKIPTWGYTRIRGALKNVGIASGGRPCPHPEGAGPFTGAGAADVVAYVFASAGARSRVRISFSLGTATRDARGRRSRATTTHEWNHQGVATNSSSRCFQGGAPVAFVAASDSAGS